MCGQCIVYHLMLCCMFFCAKFVQMKKHALKGDVRCILKLSHVNKLIRRDFHAEWYECHAVKWF